MHCCGRHEIHDARRDHPASEAATRPRLSASWWWVGLAWLGMVLLLWRLA